MKKIITFIILFLLLSHSALAYVSYNTGYPLFKFGLSQYEVTTNSAGEGITYTINIKGENITNFKSESADLIEQNNKEIKLKPITDFKGELGEYKFWNIAGTINNRSFSIFGITLEGDLIHNKIIPHASLGFIILVIISITIIVIVRKKKKTST
ncbi:hypothetical protein ACFLZH_04455 [Patescibacteria group bacterium]